MKHLLTGQYTGNVVFCCETKDDAEVYRKELEDRKLKGELPFWPPQWGVGGITPNGSSVTEVSWKPTSGIFFTGPQEPQILTAEGCQFFQWCRQGW